MEMVSFIGSPQTTLTTVLLGVRQVSEVPLYSIWQFTLFAFSAPSLARLVHDWSDRRHDDGWMHDIYDGKSFTRYVLCGLVM